MNKLFTCIFFILFGVGRLFASDGSECFVIYDAGKFAFLLESSAPVQDEIDIKVSPNPAIDYFNVTSNINFNRIQLYNIIGKPLKTYRPSADNNYQLSDIPGGLYILRFMDANNQVIKTIKLYKKN